MTKEQEVLAFDIELEKLIHRFGHEFDLTFNDMVGVLEFKKMNLVMEAMNVARLSDFIVVDENPNEE
tara:strand:+ start:1654 stop:1854 length:201 start_codon:yes stop_codon:yes gene_type:complete